MTEIKKEVNWDEFRCRCSAICKIMSVPKGASILSDTGAKRLSELEARDKPMTPAMIIEYGKLCNQRDNVGKVILSDTCIDYLMEYYAWATEGMIPVSKESLDMLATRKGTMTEAQSVALLNFIDDAEYKVHKDRIKNDFLSGQTDVYLGEHIYAATNITDMKNAWDYPIFLKKIRGGLVNGQKEQIQGYGDITGAQDLWVANTLVDNPDTIIEDMMWKVLKKIGAATFESPEFMEEWPKWYRSMKFEHISPYKRVHKIKVDPFTDEERQKVYDRVKYCREWLWEFDEWYSTMNVPGEIIEEKEVV
jgi:hypothetical protein